MEKIGVCITMRKGKRGTSYALQWRDPFDGQQGANHSTSCFFAGGAAWLHFSKPVRGESKSPDDARARTGAESYLSF